MPELTPAAVMMLPSWTYFCWRTWTSKAASSSRAVWYVVALRPFRNPASARKKAPVQTEVRSWVFFDWLWINSLKLSFLA